MSYDQHNKVAPEHLRRTAYLYIRQSTLQQVVDNTESTRRPYDLRRRAVALGWPNERIVVIDSDLGRLSRRPRRLSAAGGRRWNRARWHRHGLGGL
jgi:hypothetical protein